MTNKEFIQNLPNLTNEALIEELVDCGCDMYYVGLYKAIVGEIKHRLGVED